MAKRSSSTKQFSLGVDYGTNSVRAVIVDAANGAEVASSVFKYPSGDDGILLSSKDPNLARQNPADYLLGFDKAVRAAVTAAKKKRGFAPDRIVGIGIDTTGSTPIPVNVDGVALGTTARFRKNLDAQAWLWKDHTAHAEAAEITEKAGDADADYLAKCGGTYSSEWYWSKILHCRRVAPQVFKAAHGWVEQSDFSLSLGWMAGYRLDNGVEFGVGPNFSVNKDNDWDPNTSMVFAAGSTLPFGDLYVPLNVAVSVAKGGPRITMLMGWIIG